MKSESEIVMFIMEGLSMVLFFALFVKYYWLSLHTMDNYRIIFTSIFGLLLLINYVHISYSLKPRALHIPEYMEALHFKFIALLVLYLLIQFIPLEFIIVELLLLGLCIGVCLYLPIEIDLDNESDPYEMIDAKLSQPDAVISLVRWDEDLKYPWNFLFYVFGGFLFLPYIIVIYLRDRAEDSLQSVLVIGSLPIFTVIVVILLLTIIFRQRVSNKNVFLISSIN